MKFAGLKDGTNALLREPTLEDVDRSYRFYRELSDQDRRVMGYASSAPDFIEQRYREPVAMGERRIIAEVDGHIVGDGALEIQNETHGRRSAVIRVIVAEDHRRKRLGAAIIRELFRTAEKLDIERITAQISGPALPARQVFRRLGFRVEQVIPDHHTDEDGTLQDMVVMGRSMNFLTRQIEDALQEEHNFPDG